jgi:hypothetical protein
MAALKPIHPGLYVTREDFCSVGSGYNLKFIEYLMHLYRQNRICAFNITVNNKLGLHQLKLNVPIFCQVRQNQNLNIFIAIGWSPSIDKSHMSKLYLSVTVE